MKFKTSQKQCRSPDTDYYQIDTVRPLSSYLTNCVSESHAVLSSMLNLLVEINKEIMMSMISSSELNNKTNLTNLAI